MQPTPLLGAPRPTGHASPRVALRRLLDGRAWSGALTVLALVALGGCDSGFSYRANLANPGTPSPMLWAWVTPGTGVETLVLVETGARPFPSPWHGASNLKLVVSGTALPLTAMTASGSTVAALPGVAFPSGARLLMTAIPSSLGYLNGAASDSVSDTAMGVVVGDRVEVATLSLTTSSPATLP